MEDSQSRSYRNTIIAVSENFKRNLRANARTLVRGEVEEAGEGAGVPDRAVNRRPQRLRVRLDRSS